MPYAKYGELINAKRNARQGLRGLSDTLYTYKNKAGDSITGTESQIATFMDKSSDLSWEFYKTASGAAPGAVTVTKAGPSVWDKIGKFATENKDTLVGLVKKPKAGAAPVYVAPAKSGPSNMLMIGGIAAVAVVGLVLFMRR
jgi:hypothetical protein